MLNRTYDDQVCSVARTLEIVGERWTLLIIRDALRGVRRFDDFQQRLGIARNVLANRLERLVDAGILERRLYNEHPPRHEYRLTDRGRDLYPVIFSLLRWGDKHAAPEAVGSSRHRDARRPRRPRGRVGQATPSVARLRFGRCVGRFSS